MSKVAIQGNASGTGTFTIAAPNSNTDRTLTLPDGSATLATTNGITVYDQWYLTTSLDNPGAGEVTITANLQRTSGNITGVGHIGSAMTLSSGVFTFPSTGMWLVRLEAHGTSTGDTSGHVNTAITTDNSTYTNILKLDLGVANSGDPVRSVSGGEVLVDITDTSTHKIKFVTDSMTATSLFGESTKIRTNFTFIRLGDT